MPASGAALQEILEEFRAGRETERSFRMLFDSYCPRVIQFFRRRRVPEEDCRDLAQDVFVAVFKDIGSLRDIQRFENWLFKLSRNVFYAHLDRISARKRGAEAATSCEEGNTAVDLLPDPQKDALSEAIDRETASLLHREMTRLPPQMRECVILRVTEEASLDQIARRMAISINTVKVHLHQARKLLRKRLEPEFGPLDFTGEGDDEER